MKPGVLITRPLPFATRTAASVAALGFEAYIAPLLKVTALPVPPAETPTGAIITSATVFEMQATLPLPLEIPLYVVGAQTAGVARQAGYRNLQHVAPEALALVEWLNRQPVAGQQLVYYCSLQRAHDLAVLLDPARYKLVTVPVYDSQLQNLSAADIHRLQQGMVQWIMLYSRRTAVALAAVLQDLADLDWVQGTKLLCLSSAITEPLYEWAWQDVQVASTPDETGMLAGLKEGRADGERKPG